MFSEESRAEILECLELMGVDQSSVLDIARAYCVCQWLDKYIGNREFITWHEVEACLANLELSVMMRNYELYSHSNNPPNLDGQHGSELVLWPAGKAGRESTWKLADGQAARRLLPDAGRQFGGSGENTQGTGHHHPQPAVHPGRAAGHEILCAGVLM